MNKVYLMGRSGADAELKHTQSGMAVLSVSIATSKKGKAEGEWLTTWHRVTVWSKTAERMAPLIKKGSKVFVEGEIQTREYVDKNQQKRTSTEIMAYSIEVCQPHQSQSSTQFPDSNDLYAGQDNTDIPF